MEFYHLVEFILTVYFCVTAFASYCLPFTQLPNLKEIWDLSTVAKVIKNWHKIIKDRDRTDAGTQYVHTSFVALGTQQISSASLVQ